MSNTENGSDADRLHRERSDRLLAAIDKITKQIDAGIKPREDDWLDYLSAMEQVMWEGKARHQISSGREYEPRIAYLKARIEWESLRQKNQVKRLLGAMELHTSQNAMLALLVAKAYDIDVDDLVIRSLKAKGIDA